jgi:hypothetical protein
MPLESATTVTLKVLNHCSKIVCSSFFRTFAVDPEMRPVARETSIVNFLGEFLNRSEAAQGRVMHFLKRFLWSD